MARAYPTNLPMNFENDFLMDLGRYHQDRLRTDTRAELIRHNERVKGVIPADKLLVYEISQGWEPLVEFLGVQVNVKYSRD